MICLEKSIMLIHLYKTNTKLDFKYEFVNDWIKSTYFKAVYGVVGEEDEQYLTPCFYV